MGVWPSVSSELRAGVRTEEVWRKGTGNRWERRFLESPQTSETFSPVSHLRSAEQMLSLQELQEEAVASPSLGAFKERLDLVPGDMAQWGDTDSRVTVGPGNLEGLFQPL